MILSAPIVESPLSRLPPKFFAAHAREFAHLLTLGVDSAQALGHYFGLTPDQTAQLTSSTYFRELLGEAQDELKDCNTVVERARAMARLASPEAVTTLLMLTRNGEDQKVAKDAAETLLNLAGLSTKPQAVQSTGQLNGISINIGFASHPAAKAVREDVAVLVGEIIPQIRLGTVDEADAA